MTQFIDTLVGIFQSSGFARFGEPGGYLYAIMICVGCFLLYLAIVKEFEPLILLPMAFGMILANLPGSGIIHMQYFVGDGLEHPMWVEILNNGGLADMLYMGVKLGIYPPLIFLGIGTMTDFAPLISNPKSLLLGAAAQFGIFGTYMGARLLTATGLVDFTQKQSAAIAIIGGADGPMVLFGTLMMKPELFVSVSIIAYLYLSLTYAGYPYIIKALVPKKYRGIDIEFDMPQVSQKAKFIFIVVVCLLLCLLLPVAAPLMLSFFLGMAVKEAKILPYQELLEGGITSFSSLFLGLVLGCLCEASTILNPTVGIILILGILALAISAVGGIAGGWLMYFVGKKTGKSFNPAVGIAGISCMPTTTKLAQHAVEEENPFAIVIPIAMGCNISGVIVSAIAAGVFVATIGLVL